MKDRREQLTKMKNASRNLHQGRILLLESEILKRSAIDETLTKTGTLEMSILKWMKLTQKELSEETGS
jgi:hypothetical protein